MYCPHRDDYEQLIRKFTEDLFVEKETADKVSLRFGVYENAEREQDIDQRFICASIAAEMAEADPDKICGFYDHR